MTLLLIRERGKFTRDIGKVFVCELCMTGFIKYVVLEFDEDDFASNLDDCIANVDILRTFSYTLPGRSKQTKRKRGPPARSVKINIYHLPEASIVPKFKNCPKKGQDPISVQHMDQGYAKYL